MHQYTHLPDNPHFLKRGHMSHAGLGDPASFYQFAAFCFNIKVQV